MLFHTLGAVLRWARGLIPWETRDELKRSLANRTTECEAWAGHYRANQRQIANHYEKICNQADRIVEREEELQSEREMRLQFEHHTITLNEALREALVATSKRLTEQAETFSALVERIPDMQAQPGERRAVMEGLTKDALADETSVTRTGTTGDALAEKAEHVRDVLRSDRRR